MHYRTTSLENAMKNFSKSIMSRNLGRNRLDFRLSSLRDMSGKFTVPHQGWLQAIRHALGMTLQDLAARLGITRSTLSRLEVSEQKGTIQLDTLRRVAAAMNCDLAYVLIPRVPLQTMVDQQRQQVAEDLNAKVRTHMALEGQEETDPSLAPWRTERGDALISDRQLWKSKK